jgi:hypothetical protein
MSPEHVVLLLYGLRVAYADRAARGLILWFGSRRESDYEIAFSHKERAIGAFDLEIERTMIATVKIQEFRRRR